MDDATPGEGIAWTSYYRPAYRLDFAPQRDWPTVRAELQSLLPAGWRVALWTGQNAS